MRKYLKPAMDMEAFDVEDIIMVSGEMNREKIEPEPDILDDMEGASAPIFVNFN